MKKQFLYIWLDDIRIVPINIYKYYNKVLWARNYKEAINLLKKYYQKFNIIIDFDHDLGEEKTGYDVAKYIVENKIILFAFSVHSANPVGIFNITQLLQHYNYINI